jgi:hypothetical protein
MRSRVIAGRKAKQEGKGFENTLYVDALRQGWYVINIPQGCRWIGQNKVIAVESPFDFLIIKDGKTICLDCKSYYRDRIQYSDLEPHQLQVLAGCEENGVPGGYLVCFRTSYQIVWFSSSKLLGLQPGHGLGIEDGTLLGSLLDYRIEKILESK